MEISVTPYAFSGYATNVAIKGLTIEKYAAPVNAGAISGLGTGLALLGKVLITDAILGILKAARNCPSACMYKRGTYRVCEWFWTSTRRGEGQMMEARFSIPIRRRSNSA